MRSVVLYSNVNLATVGVREATYPFEILVPPTLFELNVLALVHSNPFSKRQKISCRRFGKDNDSDAKKKEPPPLPEHRI